MPSSSIFVDFLGYVLIGSLAAWFFYHYRRRDLLGGFWGGLVIGIVGAILIAWVAGLFNQWFRRFIDWLMSPEFGSFRISVNMIAALIGAFLFVYILNLINHNKERRH